MSTTARHLLSDIEFETALRMVEQSPADATDKAQMLMQIAMRLQSAGTAEQLEQATDLYRQALARCPDDETLLADRIRCRLGTALHLAATEVATLEEARRCFETALPGLAESGSAEEVAEAHLNLGLARQALANLGAGLVGDAISAYQAALKVFTATDHPQEFAILHNNLAIAFLAVPPSDPRGRISEALAVQSFQEVLKVINRKDHPREYAMIQNNLGNALQYAASGHPLENNLRALAAYDEALTVRDAQDSPLEYASTIANKANVLLALGGTDAARHRDDAVTLYRQALALFRSHGREAQAAIVESALAQIDAQPVMAAQ